MKLLVVLSRFPYPLTKGDKLRAFHQIKYLSKIHDIYLFCLSHEKVNPEHTAILNEYCKDICISPLPFKNSCVNVIKAFFQGKPLQVGYFFNSKAKKELQQFVQKWNPNKVYCQFVRTFDYVKDIGIPVVLDFQDALSQNMKRRSKTAPFYLKPVLLWEAKQMQRFENLVLTKYPVTTIISEADRNCIQSPLKDTIHVIPNGVDNNYYIPNFLAEKKYDILFTGNMSYPPNINAVLFLIKKIMPLVWQKQPDIKVLIAGIYPPKKIQALASEKVEIKGWVEDLRDCYNNSRIFVAPMQIGTGLQNKLLESMCMGIPCITSPLANQALMAEQNTQILISETPEEYAKSILLLLQNSVLYNQLACNGRQYVIENFSWDKYNEELNRVIG